MSVIADTILESHGKNKKSDKKDDKVDATEANGVLEVASDQAEALVKEEKNEEPEKEAEEAK